MRTLTVWEAHKQKWISTRCMNGLIACLTDTTGLQARYHNNADVHIPMTKEEAYNFPILKFAHFSEAGLLEIPNFGPKSLDEIKTLVKHFDSQNSDPPPESSDDRNQHQRIALECFQHLMNKCHNLHEASIVLHILQGKLHEFTLHQCSQKGAD